MRVAPGEIKGAFSSAGGCRAALPLPLWPPQFRIKTIYLLFSFIPRLSPGRASCTPLPFHRHNSPVGWTGARASACYWSKITQQTSLEGVPDPGPTLEALLRRSLAGKEGFALLIQEVKGAFKGTPLLNTSPPRHGPFSIHTYGKFLGAGNDLRHPAASFPSFRLRDNLESRCRPKSGWP